jgi:membrane-bound lytic murein transglycosylase D
MKLFKKIVERMYKIRKHLYAVSGILIFIVIFHLFNYSISASKEDVAYGEYFRNNYKIFGLNIPEDLDFCGEKVPTSDFAVREAIDRELLVNTYWQSQTLLMHKRANRWLPIIEPILKKNGIPDDFKYIAVVESGLTNIVSPAKATGYWQFVESTGKSYGLEINDDVDERYNVAKSTEAACKYFREAYNKFQNWTLVAASYNLGIGGVESQLAKQKTSSYYDLLLNEETSRYIFRILAIKEIFKKPKEYGFILRKKDLYPPIPTYEITVDSSIGDLTAFALSQGVTYKVLKIFNPWLRKGSLNNPGKISYTIVLPNKDFSNFNFYSENTEAPFMEEIDNKDSLKTISPKLPEPIVVHDTTTILLYKPNRGETISSVAKKYNVSEENIRQWNKLSPNEKLESNKEIKLYLPKQ